MNPHNSGGNNTTGGQIIGLEGAQVITAPSHVTGDNIAHAVEVEPDMIEDPTIAEVAVDQFGDVAIPEEGDRVIIGYRTNGRPVVLGSRYSIEDTIPDFEPGERVVGHPASDAHIKLAQDGSVTIAGDSGNTVTLGSDGTVTVNDGNTRPVMDVSTSSSDGYVTSVDVTRASNVYLPSE